MIIKSMTRKKPSFSQLIDYMEEGASTKNHTVYHNFYTQDTSQLKQAFSDNAKKLKRRKNGVYLYHEVISLSNTSQMSLEQQKQALQDIVRQYIQSRAPYNLVYGVLHEEENLHYHLVISANELDEQQPKRLSKAEFAKIKQNIETYTLQRYPELGQTEVMSQEKGKSNTDQLSQAGVELKRRTGRTPRRDEVKGILYQVFATVGSYKQLVQLLESHHLKLYKRGKHYGVLDEKQNRKHRFATLGLASEFEKLDARLGAAQYIEAAPKQYKKSTEKNQQEPSKQKQSTSQKAQQKETGFSVSKEDVAEEVLQAAAVEAMQSSPETITAKVVTGDLETDPLAAEQAARLEEMQRLREKKAQMEQEQANAFEKKR